MLRTKPVYDAQGLKKDLLAEAAAFERLADIVEKAANSHELMGKALLQSVEIDRQQCFSYRETAASVRQRANKM